MNSLREDMYKESVIKTEEKMNKLLEEMIKFSENITEEYKATEQYKEKYQYYYEALKALKTDYEEDIDDNFIDVEKYKNNPYLKLKYWISEYVCYYKKVLKKEYLAIKEPININININDIDKTITELDAKINDLKDEEKINYILNLDNIINKELK